MRFIRTHTLLTISTVMIYLSSTWCRAQSSQSPAPLAGHYPGGHVGLLGGESPEPGFVPFYISRYYQPGNLVNQDGQKVAPIEEAVEANIFGLEWVSKIKFLGMNWGGIVGVPLNNIYNRPNGQSGNANGIGIGDIVIVPAILYGRSKYFDYQWGLGVWLGSGSFTPGSTDNHGSGFSEIIYSVGGVYFPTANRRSYNISAVARIEQTFKQRGTDVNPGDDIIIDWGIGSPFIPLGQAHRSILLVGISGFVTTQITRESGINAALNTERYRCFAIGPEVNYGYVPARIKIIVRPQWEFGARNTTQGSTFWFGLIHQLKKK